MNPSLDYIMMFKCVKSGKLNRSSRELNAAGGKGINVSLVLNNLGKKSTCLGFVAGFVGKEIEDKLKEQGCLTDFIQLSTGCTRINVKVKEVDGRETEYNGSGPQISKENVQRLLNKIAVLRTGDILILSGNVPDDMPRDIYGRISQIVDAKKIELVVDAEKTLLFGTLPYKPILIKPNLTELNDMLGRDVKTMEEIIGGIKELKEKGAQNVLVSMGKDGAVFGGVDGKYYYFEAPKGTVINTVGSGDSMVAAFISNYIDQKELADCARYAVAAGSAGAFSEILPEYKNVEQLYKKVKMRQINR